MIYRSIEPVEWKVESVFKKEPILIEAYNLFEAEKVILNIHGAYGSIYSTGGKYRSFAEQVIKAPGTGVVLYQSSRAAIPVGGSFDEMDFEQRKTLFEGKAFDDELEDLKTIVSSIDEKLKGAISRGEVKLELNGNSLGGLLALEYARISGKINCITVVGTGQYLISNPRGKNPLRPTPERVAQAAEAFSGKIQIFWGDSDSIFSYEAVKELERLLKNAEVSLTVLEGVDHSFSRKNGEFSLEPYQAVIKHHIE